MSYCCVLYIADCTVGLGEVLGLVSFVVVAFSSRAMALGECSTIHSPPLFLFFVVVVVVFKWRLARAH